MPEDRETRSESPDLAAREAAKRGDVSFLIAGLADPDMRLSAAYHLGHLKARTAVPALLRNLRVKNDLDRNSAVMALGEIGDPQRLTNS